MNIIVNRFESDADATISLVSLDGAFLCFGLEDEYREDKIVGETRIPAGTYHVGLRTEGGFHQRYAARFGDLHHGMLHIKNVPGFTFILIHCGNTDEDTAGCLLVGTGCESRPGNKSISSSVAAYKEIYPQLWRDARDGNLTIHFVDNDR